jgi:hypothetical protein
MPGGEAATVGAPAPTATRHAPSPSQNFRVLFDEGVVFMVEFLCFQPWHPIKFALTKALIFLV